MASESQKFPERRVAEYPPEEECRIWHDPDPGCLCSVCRSKETLPAGSGLTSEEGRWRRLTMSPQRR